MSLHCKRLPGIDYFRQTMLSLLQSLRVLVQLVWVNGFTVRRLRDPSWSAPVKNASPKTSMSWAPLLCCSYNTSGTLSVNVPIGWTLLKGSPLFPNRHQRTLKKSDHFPDQPATILFFNFIFLPCKMLWPFHEKKIELPLHMDVLPGLVKISRWCLRGRWKCEKSTDC